MSVWLTSDLHLGHDKVAAIRGFDTTEEHDAAVMAGLHDSVRKGDQVWLLGDLAVRAPHHPLGLLASLARLVDLHIVWGNHDGGHPMHRNAPAKQRLYRDVFRSTQAYARRRIEGREVLLSHFPYTGDTDGRDEDRHVQHRLRDEGVPIIHGHTHSAKRVTRSRVSRWFSAANGTLQVHVGLDAWDLRPVPLEQVAAILRNEDAL